MVLVSWRCLCDVSVLSVISGCCRGCPRWCPGGVPVVSRWCPSVVPWLRLGGALGSGCCFWSVVSTLELASSERSVRFGAGRWPCWCRCRPLQGAASAGCCCQSAACALELACWCCSRVLLLRLPLSDGPACWCCCRARVQGTVKGLSAS